MSYNSFRIAISGNPPEEIAEELQDLFIQINLRQYLQRRGVALDEEGTGELISEAMKSP